MHELGMCKYLILAWVLAAAYLVNHDVFDHMWGGNGGNPAPHKERKPRQEVHEARHGEIQQTRL